MVFNSGCQYLRNVTDADNRGNLQNYWTFSQLFCTISKYVSNLSYFALYINIMHYFFEYQPTSSTCLKLSSETDLKPISFSFHSNEQKKDLHAFYSSFFPLTLTRQKRRLKNKTSFSYLRSIVQRKPKSVILFFKQSVTKLKAILNGLILFKINSTGMK